MKILLSIKPEFVRDIFEGVKLFEYRRSIFKKAGVTKVVVYSTMPVGKIVGEFRIKQIIKDSPQEIWRKTGMVSGISKQRFDQYFEGKKTGFALQIMEPLLYDEPIDPKTMFRAFVAPQSFRYLEENEFCLSEQRGKVYDRTALPELLR